MRLLFEVGEQKRFLQTICKQFNLNLYQMYLKFWRELGISYSTFKKYYREELTLPLKLAEVLSKRSGIKINSFKIKNQLRPNWGQVKGGRTGYKNMSAKYKNKLQKWRSKGGKKSKIGLRNIKQIRLPPLSSELAEFIGICIGDGTLSKYFVRISGDSRYETTYFNYISILTEHLFDIKSKIRKEKGKNTINLTIHSKNLCDFLYKMGLPYGDKIIHKVIIPHEILKNDTLTLSCIRGLVDSDGTVSKRGDQLTLSFSSKNKKLINQLKNLGKKYNIFTFFDEDEVGTNSWKVIVRFFELVGSCNLKNIIRFHKRLNENRILYIRQTLKYFDQYKNIKLPFKLGP